jgi:hypothetical protein
MNTKDDGGPAFPQQAVRDGDGLLQSAAVYGVPAGLSLRDYFAAKAIQGWLAGWPDDLPLDSDDKKLQVSRFAYSIANAMLKARVQP